jgi:hypothetical protein
MTIILLLYSKTYGIHSFPTHSKISQVHTLKARGLAAIAQHIAIVNCFRLNGEFYSTTSFWRRMNMVL